ncbi:MAG TPA: SWIM zinc finger family protein [Jiangellales bacterium]|nr:SWIM zinc finger family protein [Jiangellales bacterium]
MSWWREQQGPSHRRPPARGQGSRRGFGRTWWGRAWVDALTDRARLDPNRLSRGRSYARSGAVGELRIEPGKVQAEVQGSRIRPYRVSVRVRELEPSEWACLLDVVAAEVGHAAALLEGELPPEVEQAVAAAGVELLPGPGELGPQCTCPDWANPCKHAAAVCFLVSDVLDRDPFALLLLRGRGRESVLAGLRTRRGGAGPATATSHVPGDEGVPAAEAFRNWVGGSATPVLPLPPARPGRPVALPAAPASGPAPAHNGSGPGKVDVAADLDALATDAAARAWALATGTAEVLDLDADEDLARQAADALGHPRLGVLAARAGLPSRELARRGIAWRHGGTAGLAVLRGGHDRPDDPVLDEARSALGPGARVRGGRVTLGPAQLRWGADGQWYPMRRSFGDWDLTGPPDPDPVVAAERARG